MATEPINVPIKTSYDDKGAKQALTDAKKIEQAKPTLKVDADTKAATRDIDGLMKKVDKLDGDAATILLSSNATKIAGDITDLISDLDKLDAEDPQVDVKATQINDLKGDLDQVEAKLREINNVPVDIDTTSARKGLSDVRGEADQSRSVLANMVGNSTQDLGALGGVAGTAGVAIGQLGEYATEGGIGLRGLVGVAAPMLGLAAATQLVSGYLQDVAETKAFNKERLQGFATALEDLKLTAAELQEILAQGGEGPGVFIRVADETRNADRAVAAMFGTLENFNNEVAKGAPGYKAWSQDVIQASREAGASGDQINVLTDLLADAEDGAISSTKATVAQAAGYGGVMEAALAYAGAIEGVSQGQRDAEFNAAFYGDTLEDTAGSQNKLTSATEIAADKAEHYAEILEREVAAHQANAEAQQAAADAANELIGSYKSAADATITAEETFDRFNETLADTESSTTEVRDAAISVAEADVAMAQAQAQANGHTLTAVERLAAQNNALLVTAKSAKGEARTAILNYIASINGIPPERLTEIIPDIDNMSLEEAQAALDTASTARNVAITADAHTEVAQREMDTLTAPKTVDVNAQVRISGITPLGNGRYRSGSGLIFERHGGTVPDGWLGVAGEAGPEFANIPGIGDVLLTEPTYVPPGTHVTSTAETERIIERSTGGSGSVTNVTVNVPRGYHGNVLEDARRAARRSGGLYRRNHR